MFDYLVHTTTFGLNAWRVQAIGLHILYHSVPLSSPSIPTSSSKCVPIFVVDTFQNLIQLNF